MEFHDGSGRVWRFLPPPERGEAPPEGYEEDSLGSYMVPEGMFSRLVKVAGEGGWLLLSQNHHQMRFDGNGRLLEISDRHRQYQADRTKQGSTIGFQYDSFGQLIAVEDDLGRRYRFEYFDKIGPDATEDEKKKFGLLKKITDFYDRTVEYEYSEERTLDKVKLPEVVNDVLSQYSFTGANRPTLEYQYDPQDGVTTDEQDTTAMLHGEFAELRLEGYFLPDFIPEAATTLRVRLAYDSASGKIKAVEFPNPDGPPLAWTIDTGSTAAPSTEATITAPWNHEISYTIEEGRISTITESLEIDGGSPQEVVTEFPEYQEDGRLWKVRMPGIEHEYIYEESDTDRLRKANIKDHVIRATNDDAKGPAEYDEIRTSSTYNDDNVQKSTSWNGLQGLINLPASMVDSSSAVSFPENVKIDFVYDKFGRIKSFEGTGTAAPSGTITYYPDARGVEGAGLTRTITQGDLSIEITYDDDDRGLVTERTASNGTKSTAEYDSWDRPVRSVDGLSSGRLRQIGASGAPGVIVEQAFDKAGHLVYERRVQDYATPEGNIQNRTVETRYTYNICELVEKVEQTHIAGESPGTVAENFTTVAEYEYDQYGRLWKEKTPIVTEYSYDEGGRIDGVTIGSAGTQEIGYDANGRQSYQTDGDLGFWRGKYDAWDRLYEESDPTGVAVQRTFNQAGNVVKEETWEGTPGSGKLLSSYTAQVTSFGLPYYTEEILATSGASVGTLITERDHDESGRVTGVWTSGDGSGKKRREVETVYETVTGRVLEEKYGGWQGENALTELRFRYGSDPGSPWPEGVEHHEFVPDQGLVMTSSSRFTRDAFGRPVIEEISNGSMVETIYDRVGDVIQVRSGAQSVSSFSYDSRGALVAAIRPDGRGSTRYGYDRNGELRFKEVWGDATKVWSMEYRYDDAGRIEDIVYPDASIDHFTLNPDGTTETLTRRDGILLTYTWDAANRLTDVVPLGGGPNLISDGGDHFEYDTASRMLAAEKIVDGSIEHDTAVSYIDYDLADRAGAEVVGTRPPMSWIYDIWSRPTSVTLPLGVAHDDGDLFTGYQRDFDSFDRLENVTAAGDVGVTIGANMTWGGARLYSTKTKSQRQTVMRLGYIGGAGAQPPGSTESAAEWELGTVTYGSAGDSTATEAPDTVWGQFGFGWRSSHDNPSDAVKVGRAVLQDGIGLVSEMGWSWGMDTGLRLWRAFAGKGSLTEAVSPPPDAQETYGFSYGFGDQLDGISREAEGSTADYSVSNIGRILSRNGVGFAHDGAGRRIEDDRFTYVWDWRGKLISVTIKDQWPAEDGSGLITPVFAGHKIVYVYDALGRLHSRTHLGELPPGASNDTERPFIERRVFVWEDDNLLTETGYGSPDDTFLRWRKSYIPGPEGLDDAVQVRVEIFNADAPCHECLYTYLRDELGTVLGLILEEPTANTEDPPPIIARYHYTPYGEARVEVGPELRGASFAPEVVAVGEYSQEILDPDTAAPGAFVITLSLQPTVASLADSVIVERLQAGGWAPVGSNEYGLGLDENAREQIVVLMIAGWQHGATYRVRLLPTIEDELGRPLVAAPEPFVWTIPAAKAGSTKSHFAQDFHPEFESFEAARNTLNDRFPGGQTALFHGMWTDPVTGITHARARWYDARNANWLAEDPLEDIDSPNLYSYAALQPHMVSDRLGLSPYGGSGYVGGPVGGPVINPFGSDPISKMLNRDESNEGAAQELQVFGEKKIREIQEDLEDLAPFINTESPTFKKIQAQFEMPDKLREARKDFAEATMYIEIAQIAVGMWQASRSSVGMDDIMGGGGSRRSGRQRGMGRGRGRGRGAGGTGKGKRDFKQNTGGGCFVAGTQVLTEEGLVDIENIKAGDKVLSRSAADGSNDLKPVLRTFITHPTELIHLSYQRESRSRPRRADGGESDDSDSDEEDLGDAEPPLVVGTLNHPFWSITRSEWTALGDLVVGEKLLFEDGSTAVVTSTRRELAEPGKTFTTYNFEVEDWNTYFVTQSSEHSEPSAVWVHNTGGRCDPTVPAGASSRKAHQYHSFFDVKMKKSQRYLSDSVQFRIANKKFIKKMNSDPVFRKRMLKKYPKLAKWMKDGSRLSNSPPGLTWHHHETPGVLKLVDRKDHGTNHSIYHPKGVGGRDIWGGGRPGRIGKLNPDGTPKE